MIICDLTYATTKKRMSTHKIHLEFITNTGRFGTEELLDEYELTAEQLLDILQEWRDNNEGDDE